MFKQEETKTNLSVKTRPLLFRKRLVIKCMGKKEWIEKFCSYISRLFPSHKITFTPILANKYRKDKSDYESYCFINIIMDTLEDKDTGGSKK